MEREAKVGTQGRSISIVNNIDIFKAISALAFAQLYDSFPVKVVITPSELAVRLGDEFWEESQEPDTDNVSVSKYVRNRSPAGIARPTIEWLASAGFITYERYSDNSFRGVCLTAKGLESIESGAERGNRLLKAAKEITQDALKIEAKKQLTKLFSEVISWSVKNSPTMIQMLMKHTGSW
jgi:hypothetical protein